MKTSVFCFLGLSLLFISCSKEKGCSFTEIYITAPASEIYYLQDYLNNNSITATQHFSGLFYHIDNNGAGSTPGVCSAITVNYTGSLLSNGAVFETKIGKGFVLGQVIAGWQKGLQLIKGGGSIILYIPPSLAYGSTDLVENGNVVVPAGSYLKFTIDLVDVE